MAHLFVTLTPVWLILSVQYNGNLIPIFRHKKLHFVQIQ